MAYYPITPLSYYPIILKQGAVWNSTEHFFHETDPERSCMYETGSEHRQSSVCVLTNNSCVDFETCLTLFETNILYVVLGTKNGGSAAKDVPDF